MQATSSRRLAATATALSAPTPSPSAGVTPQQLPEQHVMVPMRDGTRLSLRLHFPDAVKHGPGPWPALFEQRYGNDGTDDDTRADLAELADGGFVVGLLMFRGAWASEGEWLSYRALGWGEQIDDGLYADGYDTCEWLASQPWCSGKVGTFGSSQAGFAQNFLAVMHPPSLVCQYLLRVTDLPYTELTPGPPVDG